MAISKDSQLIAIATQAFKVYVYEKSIPERILCDLYVHVLPKTMLMSPDKEVIMLNGSRRSEVSRMHLLKLHNIPKDDPNVEVIG